MQEKKQKEMLDNLAEHFFAIMKQYRLPKSDFPDLARFREVAEVRAERGARLALCVRMCSESQHRQSQWRGERVCV